MLAIRVREEERLVEDRTQRNEPTILLLGVWKLTGRWDPGGKYCMQWGTGDHLTPNLLSTQMSKSQLRQRQIQLSQSPF